MRFTHVLEPITINQVEIKNRIFRSGHATMYGKGVINDTLIAYHVARAKAGVGMSATEVALVHPTCATNRTIYAWDDTVIPGFQALARAVRPHGMKMFAQVWHAGHVYPGLDGISWGPSAVPSPMGGLPLAMTEAMIEEMIESFAATSVRARKGEMDGIEIHFGHGYLIHQFLSPLVNHRTDAYGGSLENRMRFGRRVLRAVRKAVGDDYAMGIRISDTNAPGGVTVEECAEVVRQLCAEGLIDFVNGSMGSYHSLPSMLPAMDTPVGVMLPSSGPIIAGANATRNVVRMTAGRFQTLEEADQLIRDDVADMVAIVRGMIADPDLVKKTIEGRVEEIRPCLGCNQGCVAGIVVPGGQIGCVVNPTVGMEATLHEDLIQPTANPRTVVVVGGGPAGMEAARLAKLSGHRVVLFEAQSRLGGAVNIARRAPNLSAIGDITLWLEREIYRLGVDIRLSTYAERDEIRAEAPDVVIMATGSSPRMDGWQSNIPHAPILGVDQPHVFHSHDIFDVPRAKLGDSAVIYDDIGQYEAVGIAEYLIAQGLSVTFVTRHPLLSPMGARTIRIEPALKRLQMGSFTLIANANLVEIGKGSADYRIIGSDTVQRISADCAVLISGNLPIAEVHDQMIDGLNEPVPFLLKRIGDALSPRDLQAAMAEGHMAGRFVDGR